MIKAITWVRQAGSAEAYTALGGFFSAMGFAPGKGWDDSKSRGASHLAPLGNLEFVLGKNPAGVETLVEVTSLDAAHAAAERWLTKTWGKKSAAGLLGAIEETDWKSRLFVVEPVKGFRFAFWAWAEPLKGKPLALAGDLSAEGMRFAVVVARWNAVITDRLLDGALDGLLRSGTRREDIEVIRVPGSWEIPAAARTAAERKKRPDAVITLGALLRGETAHYEAIYNEVARGIGQSQQETGVPHAFGVLTCETLEQALDRAGVKAGNKGFEAAMAAIEMASLKRKMTAGTKPAGRGAAAARSRKPAGGSRRAGRRR